MLSREANTPWRRPRTSSVCPMQTPTSSPLGRNNPPPDRPCSGARAVMKKSRSSRLSLSSNQRASTSRRGPAREPGAQVDADRGDDRVDGGLAPRGGQPGDVGQGGERPDAEDRQVGGGVDRRQLGDDRPRPGARRARRPLQAEVISVQLDGDRPGLPDHVRGGQDQGLAVDRRDDRAAALRRAPADHDGRAERPIVGGDAPPDAVDPRRGPARCRAARPGPVPTPAASARRATAPVPPRPARSPTRGRRPGRPPATHRTPAAARPRPPVRTPRPDPAADARS